MPGSFQSELGCPGDWDPACMRPWLTDENGDGTYTWSTSELGAGSYEAKVAHNLSLDESYGAGGSQRCQHPVHRSGRRAGRHVLLRHRDPRADGDDARAGRAAGPQPGQGLLAARATCSPYRRSRHPERSRWRLHWSADGSLKVDADDIGGYVVRAALRPGRDPCVGAGEVPGVEGLYRAADSTTADAQKILTGQLGLAQYDDAGRLLDATGVQIPGVLDDLYGGARRDARTA